MIRWFLLIPPCWLPDVVPGSEEGVGDRELAKLVAFVGLGFWRVWRGTDHRKEASEWGICKHSYSFVSMAESWFWDNPHSKIRPVTKIPM